MAIGKALYMIMISKIRCRKDKIRRDNLKSFDVIKEDGIRHPLYFTFSVKGKINTSTRLFFAFPSCVSFGAIERYSPYPIALNFSGCNFYFAVILA